MIKKVFLNFFRNLFLLKLNTFPVIFSASATFSIEQQTFITVFFGHAYI